MFNEQMIQLIGLSKNETKVLNILGKVENISIAHLSQEAKIPRMTTYLTLNSLKGRGLANYNHLGKRKYWKAEDKQNISKLLWNNLQNFNNTKDTTTIETNDSGFSIIQNMENLWHIWEQAIKTEKGSRIYGIQPTESLKEILTKINLEKNITPINKAISDKKLIIEGLLREDYIPSYLKYFENNKKKQRQILTDLQNRSSDMVYVNNQYLNSPVDFMMFKNKAFLINWKSEVALEIRNHDMLNFLKELFDLARGYGKKVDQSAYIKELLGNIYN